MDANFLLSYFFLSRSDTLLECEQIEFCTY
jgi:hypothetical protein